MKVSIAVVQTLACVALLGFQCLSMAQTPARKPAEPRCATLKGLEKAECERRDTIDDNAPAGVTSSMREKQKQAAKETADTDPAADTVKKKPAASSSSSEAAKAQEKRTPTDEKANAGADKADTLGKPPA